MNKILLSALLCLFTLQSALAGEVRTVKSPDHRVALLELYTSEGCSSCPPADHWLSKLRTSGISETRLIPMAFHVTYWDYIGWKDSFAVTDYDDRQRLLGRANKLNTVYTPQFVLDGKDFRDYKRFTAEVQSINDEKALVDLALSLKPDGDGYGIDLKADTDSADVGDIALFIAVIESDLVTSVEDGENEGETLKHDYVVRKLHGPKFVSQPQQHGRLMQSFYLPPGWKAHDMNIVGFAQNMHTGEVLQAVSMPLTMGEKVSLDQ